MIPRRQADMLAYADNCMDESKRAAFEALMTAEPDIARQIDEWRRQNQAIRAAFASPGALPAPIRAQGSGNENVRPERALQPAKNVRRLSGARQPPRLISAGASDFPAAARLDARPGPDRKTIGRRARRLLGALVLGAALLAGVGGVNLNFRPEETINAGLAAYRTYALGVATPVEYATADPRALGRWMASQIARVTPIPDLSRLGLTLMGGRIVAGARAPAAFLLYETRDRFRVGLIAEALDAPARIKMRPRRSGGVETVFWTGAGHGFALIGPLSEQGLADLADLAAGN